MRVTDKRSYVTPLLRKRDKLAGLVAQVVVSGFIPVPVPVPVPVPPPSPPPP